MGLLERRPSDWHTVAAEFYNTPLHRHSYDEFAGPCPICGGKDRFLVFKTGNAWCRKCKLKSWWDKPEDVEAAIAEENMNRVVMAVEARARMASSEDWREYHDHPGSELLDLWRPRLGTSESIDRWSLGYCPSCPMMPDSPSLTVPVWHDGQLIDIRHRLMVSTEETGKYRSHVPGIIPYPFNADAIGVHPEIIVIEGEIKTINLVDGGLPNTVGLPGLQVVDELLQLFQVNGKTRKAILMLDPGADAEALAIAERILAIGIQVAIADAFEKPDDILLQYGKDVLDEVLSQSRRRR